MGADDVDGAQHGRVRVGAQNNRGQRDQVLILAPYVWTPARSIRTTTSRTFSHISPNVSGGYPATRPATTIRSSRRSRANATAMDLHLLRGRGKGPLYRQVPAAFVSACRAGRAAPPTVSATSAAVLRLREPLLFGPEDRRERVAGFLRVAMTQIIHLGAAQRAEFPATPSNRQIAGKKKAGAWGVPPASLGAMPSQCTLPSLASPCRACPTDAASDGPWSCYQLPDALRSDHKA